MGYLRVSSSDQSVDSAGQRHAIERWAARAGHEITGWYADEGISGARGLEQRPGLAAAFDLCRSHRRRRHDRIEGIAAFDRSRFSRDRNLAGMLRWTAQSHGFALLTVDGLNTADESMAAVATDVVSDLIGEQARQAIRTATRAALAARRDAGLVTGKVPYGFARDGKRLVEHAEEQAVVARVLQLRSEGSSFRAIAAALNASGIRTRRGGPWWVESVRLVAMGRAASLLAEAKAPEAAE